jgi:hypothetical protein
VLEDGDLVGFLSELPGSEQFTVAQVVDVISRADYAAPEVREAPVAPPPEAPLPVEGGVFRRFLGGFRSASSQRTALGRVRGYPVAPDAEGPKIARVAALGS